MLYSFLMVIRPFSGQQKLSKNKNENIKKKRCRKMHLFIRINITLQVQWLLHVSYILVYLLVNLYYLFLQFLDEKVIKQNYSNKKQMSIILSLP